MKNIDLQKFEEELQKMKQTLESTIINLKDEIKAMQSAREILDTVDMASLESDTMSHKALLKQQEHELGEVNHALSNIKNGTYGICEKSGDRISIERLQADPATRYCLKDAKKLEK